MSLTTQALKNAFKDNKSYSGTQPFLDAIEQQNQQVMEILNSKQAALMSKLLVLRLYKDIFMTGNMQFLDRIDGQIQQQIISAAAYNPNFKSKGKNDKQTRGGMYFIQTQKRSKNNQTIQIGNSFVLLATQIVKFFAAWLPQYPEKTPSRFLQIFNELVDLGVSFQTTIYFQIDQQKKFQKNYQKWKNKHQQQTKKQKNWKKNEKQIQNEIKNKEISQKTQKIREKNQNGVKCTCSQNIILLEQKSKIIQQLKLQNLKNSEEKQNQISELKIRLQQLQKQIILINQTVKNLQKQNLLLISQKKTNSQKQQNEKDEINKQLCVLKQQFKKINELRNDALQKSTNLENQLDRLINQNNQLKNQNKKIKEKFESTSYDKNNQSIEIFSKLKQLEQLLQKQKDQKNKERQEKQKQVQNKIIYIQKVAQLTKTVKVLQQAQKEYKNNSQNLQRQIFRLLSQKQNFQKKINELQKQRIIQINNQGQQKIIEPTFQKNEEKNQFKIQTVSYNEGFYYMQQKALSKVLTKQKSSISFGNFLGLKSPSQQLQTYSKTLTNFNNYKSVQNKKKSSNSLHKTQQNFMLKTTNNNFNGRRTENNQDFINSFRKRNEGGVLKRQNINCLQSKSAVTTVFPFIAQYFHPIDMINSTHFRACCLSAQARQTPFFKDQLIELKITKLEENQNFYKIQLLNKQSESVNIRITSESQQLHIKQTGFTKITPCNRYQFKIQIKIQNVNFRYPILNILIRSNNKKQQKYKIPLPITLFSSLQLSQSLLKFQNFQKHQQNSCKIFKSQKIASNSFMKNIEQIFPLINFQKKQNGNIQSSAIITNNRFPEVQIKLKIVQNRNYIQFETQFYANSKMSEAFAKVLLQILMFIFK